MKIKKFKPFTFLILLLVALIGGSSCATGKYRKHKPVPCPCEKNRR